MEYVTKGEFIQAIIDYDIVNEKLSEEKANYKRLMYLRYEKVKSPLDYNVVGYNKKGEAVREIKSRGSYNSEEILDNQEKLDKKIEISLNKIEQYKSKLKKVEKNLNLIAEPLKSMLVLRYRKKQKLKELAKKYSDISNTESGIHKYMDRELDFYFEEEN